MKFRPHRGLLADAMKECVDLPATSNALLVHVNTVYEDCGIDEIRVATYATKPDPRTEWPQTLMVLGKFPDGEFYPVGFTNEFPLSINNCL